MCSLLVERLGRVEAEAAGLLDEPGRGGSGGRGVSKRGWRWPDIAQAASGAWGEDPHGTGLPSHTGKGDPG